MGAGSGRAAADKESPSLVEFSEEIMTLNLKKYISFLCSPMLMLGAEAWVKFIRVSKNGLTANKYRGKIPYGYK